MTYLLVLSLAAAIGWELIRYVTPWEIPFRLAPVLVILIAFGISFISNRHVLYSLAAAGGVAIFHKVTGAVAPEPVRIPLIRKPSRPALRSRRIPGL